MGLLSSTSDHPQRQHYTDLADNLSAQFDALRSGEAERLGRYRDYEDEYRRSRDVDLASDVSDYGRRTQNEEQIQRHRIPLGYQHAFVQKHAHRIAGRPPELIVPRRDSGPLERHRADTIEKILYALYRHSKAPVQFASSAYHASNLGAGCFEVYYKIDKQLSCFRSVHPGSILPIPGVDDPHDFSRVFRFWSVSDASFKAAYGEQDLPGGRGIDEIDHPSADGQRLIVEMVDKERRVRFSGGVVLSDKAHNYGFVPYVVIPNLGPIEELFGFSDYEMVRGTIAYFEAFVSRQADVVRQASNGAMLEKNTGQMPRAILNALRKGGIIPGRRESSLEPVQVADQPAWIAQHAEMVFQSMLDAGFAPPASWGHLGASTSGTDRALQLGPQLELTALKQVHWTAGLQRLNTMLLKLTEQFTARDVRLTGQHIRGYRQTPYAITLRAAAGATEAIVSESNDPLLDPTTMQPLQAPANPKDLIDGDYETDVVWNNRLDREDPQFVLTNLNLFSQGALSLYTLLERLGFADPEEEIKLIETEAQRLPWLRSGMIAMIGQQLQAMNAESGAPTGGGGGGDQLGASLLSMLGQGGGGGGALTTDALGSALNGSSNRGANAQDRVPGSTYGAA